MASLPWLHRESQSAGELFFSSIYHEGKICLTVHFRRAHTSDGIGLASWWNQVRVVHGGLSWVLVGGWRRL
uniref:Uncharacterized protein n=1 Tax=Triticum urartu TaxID=4572 RepID=A0A8R7Q9K8_TRIUA